MYFVKGDLVVLQSTNTLLRLHDMGGRNIMIYQNTCLIYTTISIFGGINLGSSVLGISRETLMGCQM